MNDLETATSAFDELRDMDQTVLVSQLHKAFLRIGSMTADQVVAAYQTLAAVEVAAKGKEGAVLAKHLKEAAASRMHHLVLDNPFTMQRTRLKARFLQLGVKVIASDNP